MKLVEFNLVENECHEGLIADSQSSTQYVGSLNATGVYCIPGNGVMLSSSTSGIRTVVSTENMVDLKQAISDSGGTFTIEMWVDTAGDRTDEQYLYSIDNGANYNNRVREVDSTSMVAQLGIDDQGSKLSMELPSFEASVSGANRTHICITYSDTEAKFYVQGNIVLDRNKSSYFGPAQWYDESLLRLLGSYDSEDSDSDYSGSHIGMYYWSLWSPALSITEIESLYDAGSPTSRPIAYDVEASVQQNGQVGVPSNDPYFYSTEIPSADLATITLNPYDFDDVDTADDADRVGAEITGLPTNGGLLYHADGTQISSVPTAISRDSTTGNFIVRLRPKHNAFSQNSSHIVSSFTYQATEGASGEGLTSFADGTVSITVTHVNQPPLPAESSEATVIAGALTILPALNGSDVDGSLANATIVSLPGKGSLFDVFPNGSIATSALSASSTLSSFKVAYIYTGSQSASTNSDYFTFALTDDSGFTSVSATYSIISSVAVVAIPTAVKGSDDESIIIEGASGSITLRGEDHSDKNRPLCVTISSAPQHGSLYDPADPSVLPLQAGATLSSCITNSTTGVNIGYNASAHFFTWPSSDWNGNSSFAPFGTYDRFSFFLSTTDGALSEEVSQDVSVLNWNEATEVTYTPSNGEDQNVGEGPVKEEEVITVRPIAYGEDNVATITGFGVSDRDRNVDQVRVWVTSDNGARLTLNREYIELLDFSSAEYCQGNLRWQCKGSGYTEDEMSFVGTPSAIALALSEISYESSKANSEDVVTVTLYDGAGDHCLDARVQSASRFGGCYSRSASVSVKVLGYEQDSNDDSFFDDDISSLLLSNVVLFGMIAFCICCCCGMGRMCYYRCFRRYCCKEKKEDEQTTTTAEEDEESGGIMAKKAKEDVGTDTMTETPTSTASSVTIYFDDIYPTVDSVVEGHMDDVLREVIRTETLVQEHYPWPNWPNRQSEAAILAASPPPPPTDDSVPLWFLESDQ